MTNDRSIESATVSVEVDQIVAELSANFDYEFNGISVFTPPQLPYLPTGYGIGLIVGPSGTGKSTILRKFGYEQKIEWNPSMAVCSHFNNAIDARERLSAVGFNSIPAWMRPYHVLSTGEKFRADLARRLQNGAVIDEFTSVVDRNVAKSCANSVRRYVDQQNISGMVFASCHYDIIEWLRPDWLFDTSSGKLTARGSERRPEIVLEMLPCSTETWAMFRHHHYLDGNINRSSRCWISTWDGTPIGFSSALSFPNGNIKNAWREHRTVVLPDYQGLGLGVRISDATAEVFVRQGYRYFSKTAHPRMGEYRNRSPLWTSTSKNNRARTDYNMSKATKEDGHKMKHANRVCYSHEYRGRQINAEHA